MGGEKAVRGDIIKTAISNIDILGTVVTRALVEFLERRGNVLDDKHTYRLKEIEIEIADIFGPEAAALLTERIRRGIADL